MTRALQRSTAALFFLLATHPAAAAVRYVDVNSVNPMPPFTNWTTAAAVIQDAVDAADPGDEVLVTNGVYATGGRAVGTNVLVNRAAVDKPLTLRGVNGPQFTIIQGYQVPGTTNGDGAIRCVYLANGASLSGFTLANGATRTAGEWEREQTGGGVACPSTKAVLTNCVIVGNSAGWEGGGASGGTLNNCTLTGNSAKYGGGAYGSTLDHCTLTSNSAEEGGGAYVCILKNCRLIGNSASWSGGGAQISTLDNCTLIANSARSGGGAHWEVNCPINSILNNCTLTGNSAEYGGGAYGGILNNCIVYLNTATDGPNYSRDHVTLNCSCTTPLPTNGVGNITNAPLFVDYASGNLRLQSNSPCINAGLNAYAPGSTDRDGRPRIVGGTVDIGAYEFQGLDLGPFIDWLERYGLPTDGSADFADIDADTMNNWQEWRAGTIPTNALSVLRLLTPVSNGTSLTVTWESVAGRSYFLECSADVSPTSAFTRIATDVVAQTNTTSFVHTNAVGASLRFYRVCVE